MKSKGNSIENGDKRTPLANLWNEAVEYGKTRDEIGGIIREEAARARRSSRWIVYSAAATVLIVVGLFGINRLISPPDHKKSSVPVAMDDTTGQADSSESLIINYEQPRKYATMAIAGADSLAGDLILPLDSSVFSMSSQVIFKWMPVVEESEFKITLLPKDTVIVNRVITPADSIFILEPGALKPGSYRWSVRTDTTIYRTITIGTNENGR